MNNNIEQSLDKEELVLIRQQVRNQLQKDKSRIEFEEKYNPEDDAMMYRDESSNIIR